MSLSNSVAAATGGAILIGLFVSDGFADGGKVQLSQVCNQHRITVFTSPTPLQVGPIDVSLLVQNESTGEVVEDWRIQITCEHGESGQRITQAATRSQATNKLLRSAKFAIPLEGEWQFTVDLDPPNESAVQFSAILHDPSNRSSWVTLIVLIPFALTGLFLLRERIRSEACKGDGRRKRSDRSTNSA